jgi:tetratricopeptide (TPR) repeat protein
MLWRDPVQRLSPVLLAFALALVGSDFAWSDSPMDQGIAAYNAGHFDQAVGLLGEAEPTNFNNPILHYYLGNALAHTNHRADAIKQYKLALVLDPSDQLASYCQTAIKNLDPKSAASAGAKPGTADKPTLAGQTPQVFAVLCGCPLCIHMELTLRDLQKTYGDKVLITHLLRNAVASASKLDLPAETGMESAKNDAIIKRYQADVSCPTLLFFGPDGQLSNKMSGVIADVDMSRQLDIITGSGGSTAGATTNKHVDDMRATIMREAQARLADAQRSQEAALQRIQQRAQQDRADTPIFRASSYARRQIDIDMQKQMEQVKADFAKKQEDILNDANARTGNLSGNDSVYNVAPRSR